jgi:VanZ family protein
MDKLAHLLEYAILGLLAGRAISGSFTGWNPAIIVFATVGLGGMVGLVDEIYQGYVPGRQRDPLDWVTDVTAIALASLVAQVIFKRPPGGAGRSAPTPGR